VAQSQLATKMLQVYEMLIRFNAVPLNVQSTAIVTVLYRITK